MSEAAPTRRQRTRTDLIALAVQRELERYREEIDTHEGMRALTITVKLNRGLPRLVLVSRETESPFG